MSRDISSINVEFIYCFQERVDRISTPESQAKIERHS